MLAQISERLPRLSPAEQRVGRWILNHPKEAANITLARLARECQTSEPTVLRFCKRLGLRGFRELAVRVTEALSRPASYVHRDVSADDSTADAAIKVLDASIQSLIDMRSQLSLIHI